MTQRIWAVIAAVAGLAGLTSCASDKTRSGGASDVYIASGGDRTARCSERIGAAAILAARDKTRGSGSTK